MSKQKWLDAAPSIVSRLRLTFAAITIALVTIGSVAFINLQGLSNAVADLTDSAFTVFVRTEETERDLKNLIILLQQVQRTESADEIAPLAREIHERLDELRVGVEVLGDVTEAAPIPDGMATTLAVIATGADLVLSKKIETLDQHDKLDQFEKSLQEHLAELTLLLERLSFESIAILQDDFPQLLEQGGTSLLEIEQAYSQELLISFIITTMTLEFESVLDKVLAMRSLTDRSEIQEAVNFIRFQLRTATTSLTLIEDTEARTQIAKHIVQMKDQILGDEGYAKTVESLTLNDSALDSYIQNQLPPLAQMSALASRLTTQQREAIDIANAEVLRKSKWLMWSLGLTTFVSLLGIGAAIYYIVERQINARMSKLTNAVLAIADGDSRYNVKVSGQDEIGKMAEALGTFKSNANELVRSNQELERFAYIAAHDLRSPLRGINDLADWIKDDSESKLSEDSKSYLSLLSKRISRLNSLLTDLLNYSRVGTEDVVFNQISLRDVVAEASDLIDSENRFKISLMGPENVVVTVATPLRQAIHNLITNSIKHHDKEAGVITVSAQIRGDRMNCTVSDDGPGIDPKYHKRVFDLFQTLRSRDVVEGSGLGLAIVRKVVEHYGGAISIISDPKKQRGTQIQFDFPIHSTQL